jgi:fatty-acyl-CoA synthase
MKLTNDVGETLPHDGASVGHLKVRGPWVRSRYFGEDNSTAHDADGWFDTGDIATIEADGHTQITDRAKDLIKSGGESARSSWKTSPLAIPGRRSRGYCHCASKVG